MVYIDMSFVNRNNATAFYRVKHKSRQEYCYVALLTEVKTGFNTFDPNGYEFFCDMVFLAHVVFTFLFSLCTKLQLQTPLSGKRK